MFNLNSKESREVAFIVGSVLFVGAIGLFLSISLETKVDNGALVGGAVSLNLNTPTETGMLYLLENSCYLVDNTDQISCYDVCHEQDTEAYCVPLEDSCGPLSENDCYCCVDVSN